jgi:hypothetical protein
MKHRWLPAIVDSFEYETNGKRIGTLTLFGWMDEKIHHDFLDQAKMIIVGAAGEYNLHSWWQEHYQKPVRPVDVTGISHPPPGCGPLRFRLHITKLLVGFSPGRTVRVRTNNWPNVKLHPEEPVIGMED